MEVQNFTAALAIAVLAGLGVGSGGLFIVYLSAVCAYGQIEAQSANLVFFIFASGASLLWHYSRRQVRPKELFLIVAGGIAGSFIGSRTASVTDPEILRKLFGVMLTLSGTLTLLRIKRKKAKSEK